MGRGPAVSGGSAGAVPDPPLCWSASDHQETLKAVSGQNRVWEAPALAPCSSLQCGEVRADTPCPFLKVLRLSSSEGGGKSTLCLEGKQRGGRPWRAPCDSLPGQQVGPGGSLCAGRRPRRAVWWCLDPGEKGERGKSRGDPPTGP